MSQHLQRPYIQYGFAVREDGEPVPKLVIGYKVVVTVESRGPLHFDSSLAGLFDKHGQIAQVFQTVFRRTQENEEEIICGFRSHGGDPLRLGEADAETFQRIKDLWELQGLELVLAETIDLENKIEAEMEQRRQRRQQTVGDISWIWS